MDFVERLNWRYAVKKFDHEKKLSDAQLNTIIETVRLSPSGYGLQPYRLILVEDPERRRALAEYSFTNRDKVIGASTLLVFAIETKMDAATVDRTITLVTQVRATPRAALAPYEEALQGLIGRYADSGDFQAWAKCQAYLALGGMLTVCAGLGVDACPMEGIVPARYDEVLGLQEKGLTTAVAAVLGQRAQDDAFGKLKKVRWPMEEFLIRV